MDFLTLAQRLRLEAGETGTETSVTPLVAASEWERLVTWINSSWQEIQENEPNWAWMQKPFSFNTTSGNGLYTVAQTGVLDHAEWLEKSFRIYLTSMGVGNETWLTYRPWEDFRDLWLFNTNRITQTRPIEYTIKPDKSIVLGPLPDDVYTVTGEYYKAPIDLILDTDSPDMPARFHMLIVYEAMMKFGAYESAQEVYSRGEKDEAIMRGKLRLSQLPMIRIGRPLI